MLEELLRQKCCEHDAAGHHASVHINYKVDLPSRCMFYNHHLGVLPHNVYKWVRSSKMVCNLMLGISLDNNYAHQEK